MDEKLDIEAITKACEEAAPPPWRCVYDGSSTWIGSEEDPQGKSYIVAYSANWMETGNESANAKFVANARQWVPALVARVRELEAQMWLCETHKVPARIGEKCPACAASVVAEREACAKLAESYEPQCESCPRGVAAAIRARKP